MDEDWQFKELEERVNAVYSHGSYEDQVYLFKVWGTEESSLEKCKQILMSDKSSHKMMLFAGGALDKAICYLAPSLGGDVLSGLCSWLLEYMYHDSQQLTSHKDVLLKVALAFGSAVKYSWFISSSFGENLAPLEQFFQGDESQKFCGLYACYGIVERFYAFQNIDTLQSEMFNQTILKNCFYSAFLGLQMDEDAIDASLHIIYGCLSLRPLWDDGPTAPDILPLLFNAFNMGSPSTKNKAIELITTIMTYSHASFLKRGKQISTLEIFCKEYVQVLDESQTEPSLYLSVTAVLKKISFHTNADQINRTQSFIEFVRAVYRYTQVLLKPSVLREYSEAIINIVRFWMDISSFFGIKDIEFTGAGEFFDDVNDVFVNYVELLVQLVETDESTSIQLLFDNFESLSPLITIVPHLGRLKADNLKRLYDTFIEARNPMITVLFGLTLVDAVKNKRLYHTHEFRENARNAIYMFIIETAYMEEHLELIENAVLLMIGELIDVYNRTRLMERVLASLSALPGSRQIVNTALHLLEKFDTVVFNDLRFLDECSDGDTRFLFFHVMSKSMKTDLRPPYSRFIDDIKDRLANLKVNRQLTDAISICNDIDGMLSGIDSIHTFQLHFRFWFPSAFETLLDVSQECFKCFRHYMRMLFTFVNYTNSPNLFTKHSPNGLLLFLFGCRTCQTFVERFASEFTIHSSGYSLLFSLMDSLLTREWAPTGALESYNDPTLIYLVKSVFSKLEDINNIFQYPNHTDQFKRFICTLFELYQTTVAAAGNDIPVKVLTACVNATSMGDHCIVPALCMIKAITKFYQGGKSMEGIWTEEADSAFTDVLRVIENFFYFQGDDNLSMVLETLEMIAALNPSAWSTERNRILILLGLIKNEALKKVVDKILTIEPPQA